MEWKGPQVDCLLVGTSCCSVVIPDNRCFLPVCELVLMDTCTSLTVNLELATNVLSLMPIHLPGTPEAI